MWSAAFSFHKFMWYAELQYQKKIIVPLFSELFVNSFGDKAQDNQDSHFFHDSEEEENRTRQWLSFL